MATSGDQRNNASCMKAGGIGCGAILAFWLIGPILSFLFVTGPSMLVEGLNALGSGDAWLGTLVGGLVMTTVEGLVLWKGVQFARRKFQEGDYGQLKTWLREQGVQIPERSGPSGTTGRTTVDRDVSAPDEEKSPSSPSTFSEEAEQEESPDLYDTPDPESAEPEPEEQEPEPTYSESGSALDDLTKRRAERASSEIGRASGDPPFVRGALVRAGVYNALAWGVVGGVFYTGWMEPSGDGLVVLALPVAALGIAIKEISDARKEQT